MIKVIGADERYHMELPWLSSYWHFSFDQYYDPANMGWGALRVFNDDLIMPGGGFEMHEHRDMEIITCVLEGTLQHQDSEGNQAAIQANEVQVMSAGRGITHSERNQSLTQQAHLLQIWIIPRKRGGTPRWEQKAFGVEAKTGRLVPVVSDGSIEGTLAIDQDAEVYLSKMLAGKPLLHAMRPGRKAYVFTISGRALVNGWELNAGDQARIDGVSKLTLEAPVDSEVIVLDVP